MLCRNRHQTLTVFGIAESLRLLCQDLLKLSEKITSQKISLVLKWSNKSIVDPCVIAYLL